MTVSLVEKIERIHIAFEQADIPHAYGGALALAYYTVPRATNDIDINVFTAPEDFEMVSEVLVGLGCEALKGRDKIERDGQVRTRWDSNPVDIFFAYDQIHMAMRHSTRTVPFREGTIPIIAPEHLLVAKVAFNRPKDWIDIEQMLTAVDDLNLEEVYRWADHLMGFEDERLIRLRRLASELR